MENEMSKASMADAIVAVTGVAKPAVEAATQLVLDLLGEPLKVAGGMMADQFYAWQTGNRIRVIQKLKAKIENAGIPPRQVATGFLLTALDAAGNVDDPTMQEMWANLLAAGVANDENQHPMYIDALKKMSPSDAQRLEELYDRPMNLSQYQIIADLALARLKILGLVIEHSIPADSFTVTLTNVGQKFCEIVSGVATAQQQRPAQFRPEGSLFKPGATFT